MKNARIFQVHRSAHTPLLFLLICLMAGCTKTETKPGDPDKYWQKASLPNTPRKLGAAGLLADGRVLLTGGNVIGTPPGTFINAPTEIYDPATDKWTTVSQSTIDGEELIRLKSGKMVLLDRSSSIIKVFDPSTKKWISPGTIVGQQGDYNTMSGACELENGNVVFVGSSSIAVWDQKNSLVSHSLNSGSESARFATVHQLPGTDRFIIFGNSYYQGAGIIYELDAKAGNAPRQVGAPVGGLSGIMMRSELAGGGKLLFVGGYSGAMVGNNPVPPTIFNPTAGTFIQAEPLVGNTISKKIVTGTDQAGNVWFNNNYVERYKFDLATQKVVSGNPSIPRVPSPFPEDDGFVEPLVRSYVFLSDGRLMVIGGDQSWISK